MIEDWDQDDMMWAEQFKESARVAWLKLDPPLTFANDELEGLAREAFILGYATGVYAMLRGEAG